MTTKPFPPPPEGYKRKTSEAEIQKNARKFFVTVYQCPVHPHMFTLCLDNADGGTRLLGSKCCPSMYQREIKRWYPTTAQFQELSEQFQNAGEEN